MIKNTTQQKKSIQAVKKKVYGRETIIEDFQDNFTVSIRNEADILFTNLNKYHLFKENTFDKRSSFYKDLIYYQLLNEVDLNYHHKYLTEEIINIKGTIPEGEKPVIYCSFHYGSYLHVSTALRMLNKSFSVVSKQTNGSSIIQWEKEEEQYAEDSDYFYHSKTIDPQALDSSFQIYNTLRKGKSILLYIDVFSNKTEENSKRKKVFELLNSKFFVASGIPEISEKLGVPLIPVICERKPNHTSEINFYEAVCNGDTKTKDYTQKAFQECFEVFSKHLKKYPAQWDQWQFIHKNLIETPKNKPKPMSLMQRLKGFFVSKNRIPAKAIIAFNEKDFQIFKLEGEDYLLNINNYKCFKISPHLSKILQSLNKENFTLLQVRGFLNPTLYTDLASKKVIAAIEITN